MGVKIIFFLVEPLVKILCSLKRGVKINNATYVPNVKIKKYVGHSTYFSVEITGSRFRINSGCAENSPFIGRYVSKGASDEEF